MLYIALHNCKSSNNFETLNRELIKSRQSIAQIIICKANFLYVKVILFRIQLSS